MLINLKDGIIKMSEDGTDKSNRITIDVTAKTYPLMIGTGEQEKFKVEWDGTLHAKDGFFSGAIYIPNETDPVFSVNEKGYMTAKSGTIGGFTITAESLCSNNNIVEEEDASGDDVDTTTTTTVSTGVLGGDGIYMNKSGTFSLGSKFIFNNNKLFIATNIYRPSADSDSGESYFLIGINKNNRL
jgi:hypothetical protein